MVAIVGGAELGLLTGSGAVLGGAGQIGTALQGRSQEGVFVNAVTGNLTVQRQDEVLVGRGQDVGVLRTYNSQGQMDDDNGDNWRLGYSRKVYGLTGTVNTAGSTIRRLGEDGADVVYTYDTAKGAYLSTKGSGAFDTLSYNASTQRWTWTDGDSQIKEQYDNVNAGRLFNITDPDGNITTLSYNASGLVSAVATANGETTYVDYDTAAGKTSNITQIRVVTNGSVTQTRVRYGYDTSNRLSTVTVDLSPADNSIADGKTYVTTYTYDGTSKRIASLTQSDGSQLQFTYVQVGADYRIQTVKDVRGSDIRTTTYAYDTTNRKTTVTDTYNQITELTYDTSGQLLSIKLPAVNGASQQTSFTYDSRGNVESVTDARGKAVSYGYDDNGNRILERDAAGNTLTRTFGAYNQLLTETAYTTPDPDGAGSGQPTGAQTTRYVYDSTLNLRFVVSPEGRVSEYRYNVFGQQTAAIRYTSNTYVVSGLTPTQSPTEAQLTTWVTSANKTQTARVDTTYNTRGQIDKVTSYAAVDSAGNGIVDGTQSTTQHIYDPSGNLLQQIDARGVATTSIANDFVTAFTYDGLGRQLTVTNALTVTTHTVYDDANRKTTITFANGLVTATTYDQAGNPVSVSRSGVEGSLGTTTYTYNKHNQLVAQTDPAGVKTYFVYDEAGRKVGQIDGMGAFTEFQYNGNNQLIKTIHYAGGVSTATLTTAATDPTVLTLASARPTANSTNDRASYNLYDSAGRLKKTIDGIGALTEYFYDGANRLVTTLQYATLLTSTKQTALAALAGEIDPTNTNAVTTTSAANDRRERQFFSSDGLLLGTLDGEGYLTEHLYDAAGQRTQTIRYATQTASASWAAGTLTTLRPSATAAKAAENHNRYFLYNSKGQLVGTVEVVANTVSGNQSFLTEIQYDLAGNKNTEIRYANPVTYTPGNTLTATRPTTHAEDQKTVYTYDALNQLTRVDSLPDGLITTYEYDTVGNLLKTTKALGATEQRIETKRYDSLGRLKQELTQEGAKALAALGASPTQAQINTVWTQYGVSYAYDTAGRLISSTNQLGHKTLFYYDQANRLTYTINALGEVVATAYNLFGNVTSTRRYGTRLSTTTLATLTGGLEDATLTNAVTAISNALLDTTETYTAFNKIGQVTTRRDALNNDTLFTYNAFGELTLSNTKTNAANVRLYEASIYDRRGLVTSRRLDSSSTGGLVSGATANTQYAYDAFGRVITTTDARGKVWKTHYDSLGRTIRTTVAGSALSKVMTYDAFGRVLTIQDELTNTTQYNYNSANRTVTITTAENISTTTIKNRHGETVTVSDGRNNSTSYTYDDNGRLKDVITPAGTTTHKYDRAGQEFEVVDAKNVRTAYSYDAAGRMLTRTVDPGGLNLVSKSFYDAKGQAIWSQDASGVWTKTEYDLKGQVTAVIVDPTSIPNITSTQTAITLTSNPGGLSLRTEFTYDARGKTLTVTEGAGSTQPQVTQYTYDKLGRRTQEAVNPTGLNLRTTYTYDLTNNVVARTDALGAVTRFVYDDKNQMIYSVDPTGAVTKTDYDAVGRVIQTTAYANPISLTSPSALALATTVAAITGRLTANAAADQIRYNVYDNDGRVRFRIDSLNYVTEQRYDAANNVVQVTRYATAVTNPATVTATTVMATHADDQTERTVYDAANRPTFTIDAENYVTQNVYDSRSQLIRQVRYYNKLAGTFATNVAPQIISPTATAPSTAHVRTHTNDITTRTTYDAAGRVRFSVDGENYVMEYRYDNLGRETHRIAYAAALSGGVPVDGVAPLLVPSTQTTGLPTQSYVRTDASKDSTTQSSYDNAGRLIQITDPEAVITRRVYDAANRITDITVAFNTSEASTTHRVYDAAGRMTEETVAYNSADASTSRYVLDAVGNHTKIIDPRGIELAETDSDWAKATRTSLGYGTTLAANLSTTQKNNLRALYTTTQTFDANGRVIQVTDPIGGTMLTSYDAFGNAIKATDQRGHSGYFYFDKNNQAIWQVDPELYGTKTTYTPFGTVEYITRYYDKVTLSLDANGNPVSGTQPTSPTTNTAKNQITHILHDKRNLQTQITDAEGYVEKMQYDAFGNKEYYFNKNNTPGTNDGRYTYTYYRNGRVKTETTPADNLNRAYTKSYEYDARGNLTKLTEAQGTPEQRITQFKYDRLNRQIEKTGQARDILDAATLTVVSGTIPQELQYYDKRGNLIETAVLLRPGFYQRTLSFYDAADRKIAELSPLGQLTRWTYNDGTKPVKELRYSLPVALPATAGSLPPAPDAADTGVREKRFSYDANNRLLTTTLPSVQYFEMAAGTNTLTPFTQDVVTTNRYDGTGNVVQVIDSRGNSVWNYYDKLGRKTGQLDGENYLTVWTYDGNGNVVQQRQYANKTTIVTTATTTLAQLQSDVVVHADDRITDFVYDEMNRVIEKTTQNVAAATVSSGSGALTTGTGAATTKFEYDGLGNIKKQTDANLAVTDFEYDKMGRVISEQSPTFTDFNGVLVRPITDYEYDGLGNIRRELQRGLINNSETDDRITVYVYGAGGLLTSQTDPTGAVTQYQYDAAGNVTAKTLVGRRNADGVVTNDFVLYQYNTANQEIWRKDMGTGEIRETRYNVFGEVTGKKLNGGGSVGWQEQTEYDKVGRILRSNQGDGAYKLYGYDANGNTTLQIQSNGANLSTLTLDQALMLSPSQISLSYSRYDKRNLLIETIQPKMSSAGEQIVVKQIIDQTIGENINGGTVTVTDMTAVDGDPFVVSDASSVSSIVGSGSVSGTIVEKKSLSDSLVGLEPTYNTDYNLNLKIVPPDCSSLGQGDFQVVVTLLTSEGVRTIVSYASQHLGNSAIINVSNIKLASNWSSSLFDIPPLVFGDDALVELYKRTTAGDVLVSSTKFLNVATKIQLLHSSSATTSNLGTQTISTDKSVFNGLPSSSDRFVLFSRLAGSSDRWTVTDATNVAVGAFEIDWNGWSTTAREFRSFALDKDGNIVAANTGTISSDRSVTQAPMQTSGGTGLAFMDSSGAIHFIEQGADAASLAIRYRPVGLPAGSALTAVISPATVAGVATPGWFKFDPAAHGISGGYEFEIEARNASGSIINQSTSSFTVGSAESVFEDIAGIKHFSGPSSSGVVAPSIGNTTSTLSFSNIVYSVDWLVPTKGDLNTAIQISPYEYPTRVVVTYGNTALVNNGYPNISVSQTFAPNQTRGVLVIPDKAIFYYSGPNAWQNIKIYRQSPTGEVLVVNSTAEAPSGYLHNSRVIEGQDNFRFDFSDPSLVNRLIFATKPAGSSAGWTFQTLPYNATQGATFDWSAFARGNYEFQYMAVGTSGNVLNHSSGTLVLNDNSPVAIQSPQTVGGGAVLMDTTGALNFLGLDNTANSLTLRYRLADSNNTWQTHTLTPRAPDGAATLGYFQFKPSDFGLSGKYEYRLEAKNASSVVLSRLAGTFNTGDSSSVSPLVGYQNQPAVVHFTSQPTTAETMKVFYRVRGSTGAYTSVTIQKVGTGAFDWDASALVADRFADYAYEYRYETYNASNALIKQGAGQLQLGANPKILTTGLAQAEATVTFDVPHTDATRMMLYYRNAATPTASYSSVERTRTDSTTPFVWDASALMPASRQLSLDYYYVLFDSSGQPVRAVDGDDIRVDGVINFSDDAIEKKVEWVIQPSSKDSVIVRKQSYNAFGEIDSETDGRLNVTHFKYNTLGLLVEKQDPITSITLANGFIKTNFRPTTTYHYDLAGRLVGVDDAAGNRNTMLLRAGTGMGGEAAAVLTEFHADGGKQQTAYDVFGDARRLTDEETRITLQTFDKAGRVTQITRPQRATGTASYFSTALTELYEYDVAGNRIAHTNADGKREKIYYDSLGRVSQVTSFAGLNTRYDYSWSETILGLGGAAVGGYQLATTLADGHSDLDNIEYFGRSTWRRDFGEHEYTYSYNLAGSLVQQTSTAGQNITYSHYANGYIRSIQDNVTGALTRYEYDAEGNRTLEAYTRTVAGVKEYYQSAEMTYDALNRVTSILDPKAEIRYEYDENGNRRRVWSYYHDGVDGSPQYQEYWYTYDKMNRFTITMGQLSGTGARATTEGDTSIQIEIGSDGTKIDYNKASERISATSMNQGKVARERYVYTADGYLEYTYIDGDINDSVAETLRVTRKNDRLGRVVEYREQDTSGSTTLLRSSSYTNDNQVLTQTESANDRTTTTTYNYGANNAGPLAYTASSSSGTTTTTYFTYEWWDEAKQVAITSDPYNKNAPKWKAGYSKFNYDVNGHLVQVRDVVADRTLTYSNDAQGMILTRKEVGPGFNKYHSYFYVDGRRVGDVGNDGVEKVSYAEELAMRKDQGGKDKYKHFKPINSADFDQNYQPINSQYPGASAGSYTVKTGETLQSIALTLWGDSLMWYLLADANGLTASETLKAGQVLTVPNKVTNIHNSSQTYQVYNPGEAIGDTQPTLPDPPPPPKPKGDKCGGLKTIIVVVVAVVATVYTAGLASAAFTSMGMATTTAGVTAAASGTMALGTTALAGGAGLAGFAGALVGGAVGSIVSQGVGMAMGLQDSFSWSGVALGAIGAGVGAGIGQYSSIGQSIAEISSKLPYSSYVNAMAVGAIGNATTQRIAVATGLQEKFSWTQVAAAGVAAGIGNGINDLIGRSQYGSIWGTEGFYEPAQSGFYQKHIVRGTLSGLMSGGAQQAMTGERPNWGLIAAQSFGNSLGSAVNEAIVKAERESPNRNAAVASGPRTAIPSTEGYEPLPEYYGGERVDYGTYAYGIGERPDLEYTTSETLYDVNDPYFMEQEARLKLGVMSLEESVAAGNLDLRRPAEVARRVPPALARTLSHQQAYIAKGNAEGLTWGDSTASEYGASGRGVTWANNPDWMSDEARGFTLGFVQGLITAPPGLVLTVAGLNLDAHGDLMNLAFGAPSTQAEFDGRLLGGISGGMLFGAATTRGTSSALPEQEIVGQYSKLSAKPEIVGSFSVVPNTGTVWDSIRRVDAYDNYPGTYLPQAYITNIEGKDLFVAPNATRHIYEDLTRTIKSPNVDVGGAVPVWQAKGPIQGETFTYLPDPLRTQTSLSSFHNGVANIIQTNKVQFNKIYYSNDGWEIIFAPPRSASELPAIKHARQLNQ